MDEKVFKQGFNFKIVFICSNLQLSGQFLPLFSAVRSPGTIFRVQVGSPRDNVDKGKEATS